MRGLDAYDDHRALLEDYELNSTEYDGNKEFDLLLLHAIDDANPKKRAVRFAAIAIISVMTAFILAYTIALTQVYFKG